MSADEVTIDLSGWEPEPQTVSRSEPVSILYRGSRVDLDDLDEHWREQRTEAITEGTILLPGGAPMGAAAAKRLRARLLGTYEGLSRPQFGVWRRTEGERRWLIPGLWPWGTIPVLGGNPKAGKTTLLVDLVASLLVPDRMFLGAFGPIELRPEERARGVWFVNAETPADDLSTALDALRIDEATAPLPLYPDEPPVSVSLMVESLEETGGAGSFDLTNSDNYDLWLSRFTECEDCDGTDDSAPVVVVVDGLTAILHAAGKGTEAVGLWYAQFRRLMRELDVPNAIVSAHNTLAGGHLMGGVEAQAGADGLWSFSSTDPDNPRARRWFAVVPRIGGVPISPTPVALVDGHPVLVNVTPPSEGSAPRAAVEEPPALPEDDEEQHRRARIVATLDAAGAAGLRTTEVTGRGRDGRALKATLDRLVAAEEAVSAEEWSGRARAVRYWLARHHPS